MKKQVLWSILGAMLGTGGAVVLKPAFDSEATIKPRLEIGRTVYFEVACPPIAPVEVPAVTVEVAVDAGGCPTDPDCPPTTEIVTVTPAWTDYGPDAGPCHGLEVCASIYATDDTNARAIAQGCASGNIVEPPVDAGLAPLARIETLSKQTLRQARYDWDAGKPGKAGIVTRAVLFACEACSTVDGGTPWGIEGCDESGCAGAPLDNFPATVRRLAEDFYAEQTAPDAAVLP